MGAWGGLCIFDYAQYTHAVVPAFQAGEAHPLIQQALMRRQQQSPGDPSAFRGLTQLATACDRLMLSCTLGRAFWVCDGRLSAPPQPGQLCSDGWGYEEAADLFERVLTRAAITHYAILGLAFTAVRQLIPPELGLDDDTQMLVELLDDRCAYWAAGTGGYGEGLRGWLDPEETKRLLMGLTAFAPAIDRADERGQPRIPQLIEYCGDSVEEYAHHIGRLRLFLAILQIARSLGRGVLWGRDLQLFYSAEHLFAHGETRPVELK
jgi:hypothetical protein